MDLDRRTMLVTAASYAVAAPAMARTVAAPEGWYRQSIIIDGLGNVGDPYGEDGILRMSDRAWTEIRATGVTAVRDSVLPVGNSTDGWAEFQKNVAAKHDLIGANPDRLILARTSADILKAKSDQKLAVILGTQDSSMIGPDLDRLSQMKKDGIRTVQLTYNVRNLAGDGSLEPANAGLSMLGKAMVERIEGERLLLDLSHGGARTMAEAAAFAKRPLVISHTGARALTDHVRNTSDETIRAVASKGGVVGVYFMPYLAPDGHPKGADLIAHIEHIANVAGEDHVGIGTDNGPLPIDVERNKAELDKAQQARIAAGIAAPGEAVGIYPIVEDYNSIDRYQRLARDLSRRGWGEARLQKLFGGNFMRVYREAWGA